MLRRTGRELSLVTRSAAEDVDTAVASARAAQPAWARLSGLERGRLLTKAAAIVRENLEDIARCHIVIVIPVA